MKFIIHLVARNKRNGEKGFKTHKKAGERTIDFEVTLKLVLFNSWLTEWLSHFIVTTVNANRCYSQRI